MSDRFDDPMDLLNAIEEQEKQPQPTPSRKKAKPRKQAKPSFSDPLEQVSAKEIGSATQSRSMAGQYKRKTFLVMPQQLDYLYHIAETEGMGIMETHRWLLDIAFQAYDAGTTPDVATKTVRVRAKMSHWSGNTS